MSLSHDVPAADPEVRGELFGAIFRSSALGIALLDLEGRILHTNPALQRVTGYSSLELHGRMLEELIHPEDQRIDRDQLWMVVREGLSEYQTEKRFLRGDGAQGWVRLTVSLVREGTERCVLVIAEDITERKQARAVLERERAYFEQLFVSSPEGVVLVDPEDRVLRLNPEFTRLFGYTRDEAVGKTMAELLLPEGYEQESHSITRRVAGGERVQVETTRRRKDGSSVDVSVIGVPILVEGSQIAVYGIYRDIGERKAMERALRQLSDTDALTGLYNRRGFFQLAEREWERAQRTGEDLLLLYIDLDAFKRVNDVHGHAEGDRALQDMADLLRSCLRSTDVIGRIGGDEFVALVVGAGPATEESLAERLRGEAEQLAVRGERPYTLSFSVGGCRVAARDALSVEELLGGADRKMYLQKWRRKRERIPAPSTQSQG